MMGMYEMKDKKNHTVDFSHLIYLSLMFLISLVSLSLIDQIYVFQSCKYFENGWLINKNIDYEMVNDEMVEEEEDYRQVKEK